MGLLPPTRFWIGIMMFFACWVNYMMRVNISVNIIAMVPMETVETTTPARRFALKQARSNNTTPPEDFAEIRKLNQPAGTDTFTWTEQEQGLVLSGYFWGYATTCVIGGMTAEYFGPKKIITITMIISTISTMVSPACARVHYLALFIVRIICGAGGGFLYPALHTLVAHWSPPQEKGKFVSSLLGGGIGTAVTWAISGPLIENFGWGAGFYVPGGCSIVWLVFWWFVVYDSPTVHPRISEKEKKYILDAIGDKVSHTTTKAVPPLKKIITSLPFLAMTVLHFGSNWGLYFIMTAAPKFLANCLNFTLTKTGTLAALPYLARMTFSLGFGSVGDIIVKRKLMPLVVMRKFFTIFSHIIPGLLLICVGYAGFGPYGVVALMTISLGSNGAACLTNLANHQDLAPNYAGTLYGLANGVGNTAGFITPLVTAHFTKHGNGFSEWRPVFLVGASIYIGAAIYFILFGRAATQKWNYDGMPKKQENRLANFFYGSSSTTNK